MRACSELALLVTSRQPLGVDGETVWRVPSLSIPQLIAEPGDRRDVSDTVEQSESGTLFVERARAADASFQLRVRDAAAVAEICRRLDGIPLAIELAAVRSRVLSPEQITHRLNDRPGSCHREIKTWLATTARYLPRLIGATIFFRSQRRSYFDVWQSSHGSWSLEAAEAVCSDAIVASADILDILGQLIDKSIVQVIGGMRDDRYHLLETMHQYALARLRETDEEPRLRQRHGTWYMALSRASRACALGARPKGMG